MFSTQTCDSDPYLVSEIISHECLSVLNSPQKIHILQEFWNSRPCLEKYMISESGHTTSTCCFSIKISSDLQTYCLVSYKLASWQLNGMKTWHKCYFATETQVHTDRAICHTCSWTIFSHCTSYSQAANFTLQHWSPTSKIQPLVWHNQGPVVVLHCLLCKIQPCCIDQ